MERERDDIEPVANERLDRALTGTATVVPFIAVGAAAVLTWQSLLHWSDVFIFVILYVLTGLGSRSASTGTSPTGRSRRSGGSAPCSPRSGRWRSRAR